VARRLLMDRDRRPMLTPYRSAHEDAPAGQPIWLDDTPALFPARDDLQRFRDGDRSALELVYRAYREKITAIVRQRVRLYGCTRPGGSSPEVIGDLVQDIFVRAFAPRARRAFDGVRDYGPYLFALARNVLVDWARCKGREVPTDGPVMETLANARAETAVDEQSQDPRLDAVVASCLEGLDPTLRAVHERRYRQGLSQQQAAQALGVSRQSLRTLESRLRDGLRRALQRHQLGFRASS
jgi:RNA polymerase sigma factor (sigma-70 family)